MTGTSGGNHGNTARAEELPRSDHENAVRGHGRQSPPWRHRARLRDDLQVPEQDLAAACAYLVGEELITVDWVQGNTPAMVMLTHRGSGSWRPRRRNAADAVRGRCTLMGWKARWIQVRRMPMPTTFGCRLSPGRRGGRHRPRAIRSGRGSRRRWCGRLVAASGRGRGRAPPLVLPSLRVRCG